MAKLNPQRLIFGLFLLVVVVVMELAFHQFHLSGWPAFMVMVFFFVEHMDIKKASHILVGGAVGILATMGFFIFLQKMVPVMGQMPAILVYICVAIYLIVAFGEVVPMVFNNYAFMYLTVAIGVAAANMENAKFIQWLGIELVGGAFSIACIIGILKIMGALFAPPAAASEAQQGAAHEG